MAVNYLAFEQSDAEELQNLLESEGHKIFLIPGDISDETSCRRIVKAAADALGGLDNLTMVAGRQQYNRDIMTLSSEQMVKTFATNVFSLFWLTQAALPFLPEGGTIVTTSSVQAYYPGEILIDYASTKCAIIGFTRALAKQVASKGILRKPRGSRSDLDTVADMRRAAAGKYSGVWQKSAAEKSGAAGELAPVYVFLASGESSYVTAEVYGVTGGLHLM